MKLKSKHIMLLLIIYVLFSITAVSASDNQIVDTDYGVSQSIDEIAAHEFTDQACGLSDENPGEIVSNAGDVDHDESIKYGENIDNGDLLGDGMLTSHSLT